MIKKGKDLIAISLILLFIVGQLILIRRILLTFEENIQLTYSGIAHEAIMSLNYSSEHQGFDKVIQSFDNISGKYLFALATASPEKLDEVKLKASEVFSQKLSENEEITAAIKRYFHKHNLKEGYSHQVKIEKLVLQPFEPTKFPVLPHSEKKDISQMGIKVNTFYYESEKYIVKISTYIRFDDKYKLILRESSTIIIISLLCISIVLSFYLITLLNLRKEKKLSKMKTDFMNNLMHELKTPLATISLAGKNLEMEQVLNSREDILNISSTIQRQNIHLNKLVNHIVDISMWEKEQFKIERIECDLNAFAKELVLAFRTGQTKEIEIVEDYGKEIPPVSLDAFHFTTLLNNLLSNAVKYNSEPIKIEIKTEYNTKHKITINDNGFGISSGDQKHLFDKFFRAGNGNIHKTKGLGLGLYFVKKIIDAHGGDINVSSKPDTGSSFTITL